MRPLNFSVLTLVCLAAAMPVAAETAATGSVARAQFTHGVTNREPVDQVVVLDNNVESIAFFTDLRDLQGRTITHRWEYQGRVMAEVDFAIGGPRWRVHSEKQLLPEQTGMWTVTVVDERGWPLHAEMFKYTRADSEPDVDEPAAGASQAGLHGPPCCEAEQL